MYRCKAGRFDGLLCSIILKQKFAKLLDSSIEKANFLVINRLAKISQPINYLSEIAAPIIYK